MPESVALFYSQVQISRFDHCLSAYFVTFPTGGNKEVWGLGNTSSFTFFVDLMHYLDC